MPPPLPPITIPSASAGKSKKPKRPPGPVSASYAAGQLLKTNPGWRPVYSLIEREAKQRLGSNQWAAFVLAQLIAENPNGPPARNLQATVDEVTEDITQTGGVSAGANYLLRGATGGGLAPLPPALPGNKAPSQAKSAIYNGWATIGKNGKLTPSDSPTPPKNVVTFNGLPITVAQFNSYQKQLNSIYIAYTGKSATAVQVAKILTSGIDLKYTLPKQLMLQPGFRNSPVWKQSINGYQEAWFRVYGGNEKADLKAIQTAMANRVSPTDFMYGLRNRADYTRSVVYQENSATLQKEYEAIYGKADSNGLRLIHEATLAGWNPDEFAAYLRKQPGYTNSVEYQTKLVGFLSGLGLVLGGEPTLSQPAGPAAPLTGGAPPPDSRIPSPTAGPTSNLGLVVGPSGQPPTGFLPAANPGGPGG